MQGGVSSVFAVTFRGLTSPEAMLSPVVFSVELFVSVFDSSVFDSSVFGFSVCFVVGFGMVIITGSKSGFVSVLVSSFGFSVGLVFALFPSVYFRLDFRFLLQLPGLVSAEILFLRFFPSESVKLALPNLFRLLSFRFLFQLPESAKRLEELH